MARSYVPAAIQSTAHAMGHLKGTHKPCPIRLGPLERCLIKFGNGEIDYNSYYLYVKAIATAVEGLLAIFTMGIADYSNYKKSIMIGTIFLYGACALPFAGLYKPSYGTLVAMSVLFAALMCLDSVYQILEGSFIPIFMRSRASVRASSGSSEYAKRQQVLNQGSFVSVMGLVIGNVGGLTASIIGVIITYKWGSSTRIGYQRYLLAVTIAGCISITAITISAFVFPSVKGLKKPQGQNLIVLSFKRYAKLIKDIRRYPEAWKLCIGWVIWDVSYSNFLSIFPLLFRVESGLASSDGAYTVFTFMMLIDAIFGSLIWMFLYPRLPFTIKHWAYFFLFISFFSNFWGALGVNSNVEIGFKHTAEFWVFQVLYVSSSSALRSLNRVWYSSMLPEGSEAQYFGLEIALGVAVGWIGSLVNASIQNRTGNLRWPMIPNCILVVVAVGLYIWSNPEKGMKDAEKLINPGAMEANFEDHTIESLRDDSKSI